MYVGAESVSVSDALIPRDDKKEGPSGSRLSTENDSISNNPRWTSEK